MEMEMPFKTGTNNGKLDEEFNNFMHRVNEVDSIIKKLASKDNELQKQGDEEAKKYLGEERFIDNMDEEKIVLKITKDRTVLNKKAFRKNDMTSDETSKESFMEEMSKDAEMRYQNKLVRKEKMETFKKQANLSFRRGEYERALGLYNKAIEQIKDSTVLYNNRALCYIKLGFLDKAKNDLIDWALRVNEDSLKSWLLLTKIAYLSEDKEELRRCEREAKQRNPEQIEFIDEYVSNLSIDSK